MRIKQQAMETGSNVPFWTELFSYKSMPKVDAKDDSVLNDA